MKTAARPLQIFLGTGNRHKVKEISVLISDLDLQIKTPADFSKLTPVKEDGNSLEENAIKKAKHYARETGWIALADDTGLEVPALGGEPGVRSARYAGEKCSYADNNRKLLRKLDSDGNGNRTAFFRCVVAVCDPRDRSVRTVEGSLRGQILRTARGENGFGYDPIFYLPKLRKTLAELSLKQKNKISHRAIAMLKAKKILKELS